MSNAKNYCYKDSCEIVRSGFHLENYPVCRDCKQELTEALYRTIQERQKDKEKKNEKKEEDPADDPWGYI